jgi:hypothetical protein
MLRFDGGYVESSGTKWEVTSNIAENCNGNMATGKDEEVPSIWTCCSVSATAVIVVDIRKHNRMSCKATGIMVIGARDKC